MCSFSIKEDTRTMLSYDDGKVNLPDGEENLQYEWMTEESKDDDEDDEDDDDDDADTDDDDDDDNNDDDSGEDLDTDHGILIPIKKFIYKFNLYKN
jgi:hypothetical protein